MRETRTYVCDCGKVYHLEDDQDNPAECIHCIAKECEEEANSRPTYSSKDLDLIQDLELLANDFDMNFDRDWLMEKVDIEMQQTCEYSDEEDGYIQTDRISKLYDTVEKLCDMISEYFFNQCTQVAVISVYSDYTKLLSYIQHLIDEDIDERCMIEMHKKIKYWTTKYNSDYLTHLLSYFCV